MITPMGKPGDAALPEAIRNYTAPFGTYCTHCGERHPDDADWPRTCSHGHTMWNPVPSVGVALVPIRLSGPRDTYGLLAVKRGIEPMKGRLALPGGYQDGPRKIKPRGESWQETVVRELKEESNGTIDIPAGEVREFMTRTGDDGRHTMNFGIVKERSAEWLQDIFTKFKATEPTEETEDLILIQRIEPAMFGFPTHQEAAERFFEAIKPPHVRAAEALLSKLTPEQVEQLGGFLRSFKRPEAPTPPK
jgi:ADP-ribose pyrophosphatase YjhB (NUDIX family)